VLVRLLKTADALIGGLEWRNHRRAAKKRARAIEYARDRSKRVQHYRWTGRAFIRGGRAAVRQAVYMPALVASRFNPNLKAKYNQLTTAGNPAKLALTAIIRKLKLYLLVAIDRTSKFAFVELHEKVARRTAGDFLRRLIAAVPYKVHTVLTDNGTHFTTPGNTSSAAPDIKAALDAGEPVRAHAFEYACAQNDIDHRLTKPKRPWTNGQVERMNRTIKDATVKRYFYETHNQLRTHLRDFVDAYNFARRLKTLKGLTPFEFICKRWTIEPKRFRLNPLQQLPGLNI